MKSITFLNPALDNEYIMQKHTDTKSQEISLAPTVQINFFDVF